MMEWETIESEEVILAAWNGDAWEYSGNFSELMRFVFSDEWSSNVNAQYYETFWKGVLADIEGKEGPLEIMLDMEFTFGVGPEEEVRAFMTGNKNTGPRILVMHRGDEDVSMTSAWLREFKSEPLSTSI